VRILITGGGTGGHVYPGITIAQAVRDKVSDAEILFVGSEQGLEVDVVPREGFNLVKIPLAGLPRRISPRLFVALGKAAKGFFAARKIIREFKPDVAVGTGGYVCGPVILAAILSGVPTALQEQNTIPGLTNRLLGRYVKRVYLGYEEAARFFKRKRVTTTGNPIRQSVLKVARADGAQRLGLDPAFMTVLVVGASQGARSINEALLASLPRLMIMPRLQFLHITGQRNYAAVLDAMAHLRLAPQMAARVHTVPYLHNMPDAYAAADLAVSRAGAISLAEMTARGLPMLLVPYPHATADHQTFNARALEKRGAARVIRDEELTSQRFQAEIIPLLKEQNTLSHMKRASLAAGRPEAADLIATDLIELAGHI